MKTLKQLKQYIESLPYEFMCESVYISSDDVTTVKPRLGTMHVKAGDEIKLNDEPVTVLDIDDVSGLVLVSGDYSDRWMVKFSPPKVLRGTALSLNNHQVTYETTCFVWLFETTNETRNLDHLSIIDKEIDLRMFVFDTYEDREYLTHEQKHDQITDRLDELGTYIYTAFKDDNARFGEINTVKIGSFANFGLYLEQDGRVMNAFDNLPNMAAFEAVFTIPIYHTFNC